MDERFIKIEDRITYMEKYVADLDEVVQELCNELSKCKKQLEMFQHQLQDSSNSSQGDQGPDAVRDRPPHW